MSGITSGLRSLLRRKRVGQELDEELSAFLEMAAEEKMKQRHKPQRGTSRSATGTGKPRSHKGSGLCETLALTVIGIAVGIPCAMAAARLIAHLLFQRDPLRSGHAGPGSSCAPCCRGVGQLYPSAARDEGRSPGRPAPRMTSPLPFDTWQFRQDSPHPGSDSRAQTSLLPGTLLVGAG